MLDNCPACGGNRRYGHADGCRVEEMERDNAVMRQYIVLAIWYLDNGTKHRQESFARQMEQWLKSHPVDLL